MNIKMVHIHMLLQLLDLLPVDVGSSGGPHDDGKDDAGHEEDDEESKEQSSAHGEVNLGLEGEQSQAQGDSSGEANSIQERVNIIVAEDENIDKEIIGINLFSLPGDCSEHDSLTDCEDSQEEKMKLCGVFLWMLEKQERAMMQAKARPQLVYISHLFSLT